ncbi:hypothetical protein F4776DRAFT_668194 [Hypoxylon sp. NC0597]|nr:hypothetical protein F4776DRAFT_668194 [Hypoxylon sp. NC0597]
MLKRSDPSLMGMATYTAWTVNLGLTTRYSHATTSFQSPYDLGLTQSVQSYEDSLDKQEAHAVAKPGLDYETMLRIRFLPNWKDQSKEHCIIHAGLIADA